MKWAARFFLAAAFCVCAAATPSPAYTIPDPMSSLSWDDMGKAPLVVEAVYDAKSSDKILALKVVRVLKGDTVKPGDILSVNVEKFYRVFPGGPAQKVTGEKFTQPPQLMRPLTEGDTPFVSNGFTDVPGFEDLSKPMVYFFPAPDKLALEQYNQGQDGRFVEDWANMLAGKPTDVYFRVVQDVSREVSQAALVELHRTRDAKAIEKLLAWTSAAERQREYAQANGWFAVIGDHKGDVFDPLLQRFDSEKTIEYVRWQIGWCMAIVDLKRAGAALSKRAVDGPFKDAAASELRWVPTEEALAFLLERLAAGDRPKIMLYSLGSILHRNEDGVSTPEVSKEELARLRELAAPKLKGLLSSEKLDQKTKDVMAARFGVLWGAPATSGAVH